MLTKELLEDLSLFIQNNYIEEEVFNISESSTFKGITGLPSKEADYENYAYYLKSDSLEDFIEELDLSFSESVLKIIKEKNLDDIDVYKRAKIGRKLFSKLRNDISYTPSRNTAICLCIGLKLDYEESQSLLSKAGYTLSKSSLSDVIVEYFIRNKKYDVYLIDEALYANDQKTLLNY